MEEKLKALLEEIFPDQSEGKYIYLTKGVRGHYSAYNSGHGYNANENLLKCIFILVVGIQNAEFEDVEEGYNEFNLNYKPLKFLNGHSTSVFGYTQPELYNIISTSRIIGYDGSGGDYYVKFSSDEDKLFATDHDFEGIHLCFFGLKDIIEQKGAVISSLYDVLKEYHGDIIGLNNCSEKEYSIFTDHQLLNLCMGLGLDYAKYMRNLSITIEPNYFRDMIVNPSSRLL